MHNTRKLDIYAKMKDFLEIRSSSPAFFGRIMLLLLCRRWYVNTIMVLKCSKYQQLLADEGGYRNHHEIWDLTSYRQWHTNQVP